MIFKEIQMLIYCIINYVAIIQSGIRMKDVLESAHWVELESNKFGGIRIRVAILWVELVFLNGEGGTEVCWTMVN